MSSKPSPEKNSDWKRTLLYIWVPISIVLTSIDLINMFEAFWPSAIKWVDFFQVFLNLTSELRDFLMIPLFEPIEWVFDFNIPNWLRSYLFISFLFGNTTILAMKIVMPETINQKHSGCVIIFLYVIFIFAWPILLPQSMVHWFLPEKLANKISPPAKNSEAADVNKKITSLMGRYLLLVLLVILFFTGINYAIMVNSNK